MKQVGLAGVESGRVVVLGPADYWPDAAHSDVTAGLYRVRVLYAALDTLSEDGLDGDDRYHVQLWRAPATDVRVLKARTV